MTQSSGTDVVVFDGWCQTLLKISREFNELVNMTSAELESWLKEEQSQSSGWSKDDGSSETVGHERLVSSFCIRCISTATLIYLRSRL